LEEKQAKPYAKLDRFGPGPRTQKMFATAISPLKWPRHGSGT